MIRKYAEIFCWKNVSSFCSAKATHIFSAKNIRILCIKSARTVNEMTLNKLVKLTTLSTTGPWAFLFQIRRLLKFFSFSLKQVNRVVRPFLPQGYNLNNLDRSQLDETTYQISAWAFSIQTMRSKTSLCKTSPGAWPFSTQGYNLNTLGRGLIDEVTNQILMAMFYHMTLMWLTNVFPPAHGGPI